MSMRPNRPSSTANATPSSAIDFKNEFATSALAASHDETVTHILSRLDQLQTKIANQTETPASASSQPASSTSSVRSVIAASRAPASGDLHSRLVALETVHEDSLKRLGSKLDTLEKQLSVNKEAEVLMNRISSKFGAIESQLNANKGAESLMSQIATKFAEVETRLKSAMQLGDRMSALESRMNSRASSELDPAQERLIASINLKLDIIEKQRGASGTVLGSEGVSSDQRDARIKYLTTRVDKLTKLKEQYQRGEYGGEE